MPNRLAREPSPYLLQHADNPVDWYPWGEEAFERARREDKPIFLSVGYSTCHWCHVMEHESFESEEIAARLNRDFVPIKVDREERPDVDRVYMTFVQATTGSGGWPMSVWLTPQLKPFFGGTYYPPRSQYGRPGFVEVLTEIARAWSADRSKLEQSAAQLLDRLQQLASAGAGGGDGVPQAALLADGVEEFRRAFDTRRGGFGAAPKFPRPSELLFLLREHARSAATAREAAPMATATLRAMALGGMRDHLGGGFHRYSVDADWRVPHFEKMLYDQAQLVLAYLEGAQATGEDFYRTVAEDTLGYVQRDLTDEAGGFYSAEDADSEPADGQPPEGGESEGAKSEGAKSEGAKSEGAFYIWRASEVASLLGPDADVVRYRFGIEDGGNAPFDPHGEFTGRNLLYIARQTEDVARLTGRPVEAVMAALARARPILFEARSRRPRPHLDDKILTAWNGLMIAAFARAARLTPDPTLKPSFLESATRAAEFLRGQLWDAGRGRLLRRYRAGHAAIDAYCEDYAYLIWGLLELFQATGAATWLRWALDLQRRQDELFWDAEGGGWFSTTGEDASVLLRFKEDYDGAEPAPSSVATMNLLTLAQLVGASDWSEKVGRTLGGFAPKLRQAARMLPMMMTALSGFYGEATQVVIVGDPESDDTRALHAAAARRYLPRAVTVPLSPGAAQREVAELLPFVAAMACRDGRATAYVCRDFVCREPVTEVEALDEALLAGASSG